MKERQSQFRLHVSANSSHGFTLLIASLSHTMVAALGIRQRMFIPIREAMSTENVEMHLAGPVQGGPRAIRHDPASACRVSRIGALTVVDSEKERRQVSAAAVEAIQRALRRAGVEFIDENGGGPGVRLRKRQKRKTQEASRSAALGHFRKQHSQSD